MNNEKTITICGKEVKMRYCAAAETGYERMFGKSIDDIDFNKQEDLIRLSLAAIFAAYLRDEAEAPVTSSDILSDAKPKELIEMFKTIFELRAAWYEVPAVVKQEIEEKEGNKQEKNA